MTYHRVARWDDGYEQGYRIYEAAPRDMRLGDELWVPWEEEFFRVTGLKELKPNAILASLSKNRSMALFRNQSYDIKRMEWNEDRSGIPPLKEKS